MRKVLMESAWSKRIGSPSVELHPKGHVYYNRPVSKRFSNRMYALLIIVFMAVLAPLASLEAQATWMTGKTAPEDLKFELVTIEPGDELYTWWGHTAIVVTDLKGGESRFYNYGLFSFGQERFFANFAMGRLWFEVQALRAVPALKAYGRFNRTIRVQRLNVPIDKRLEVARFLEVNILPENRKYLYDHYFDNCATRVRDLLDMASGGALKAATQDLTNVSFRQITRRFSGAHFFADTLLMFLMGGGIDGRITEWETMFLPTELELQLDNLMITDSSGRTVPFVEEKSVSVEAVGRGPIPDRAPSALPRSLALGGGAGVLIALLAFLLRNRRKAREVHFGLASSIIGLGIGLPALILTFMALFTDHAVTFWNENIILATPFVLAAALLGILFVSGVRRAGSAAAWLWLGQFVLALVYLLLKLLPAFVQSNWPIVAIVLPIYASLTYAGHSFRRGQPEDL